MDSVDWLVKLGDKTPTNCVNCKNMIVKEIEKDNERKRIIRCKKDIISCGNKGGWYVNGSNRKLPKIWTTAARECRIYGRFEKG